MAEKRQPQSNDALKKIQAAWGEAQAQLVALRQQVEFATRMAQAKVEATGLGQDLDAAYRDFGEAVWVEVSKGNLELPARLASLGKRLEEITAKIQAKSTSIDDLLAEGTELAERLQEKMVSTSKGVAGQTKKR